MFELYTEEARRVIFFARLEASHFQSPSIDTEHLLLGLLREYKGLADRFPRNVALEDSIRAQVEAKGTVRVRTSTSEDMPLSEEGKRVLACASEEADRMGHNHIWTEHLLLGLLREEKCSATVLLNEREIELKAMRKKIEHQSKQRNQRFNNEAR